MAETRRQTLHRLLRKGPVTVLELSRQAGVPVKSVVADLEHVIRGLKGKERLIVQPSKCLSCGFTFKDGTRLTRPSRCPKCRGESIQEPEFFIEDRK